VAHDNAATARQSFLSSSAEIASTLQLAILHEQDLNVSASTFVSENPAASNAQFGDWVASENALIRYPELIGIGQVVIVPAAQLPAFAARAKVDPVGPLSANGTFQVEPPGQRPYYCLLSVAVSRSKAGFGPAGDDFCAPGVSAVSAMSSRDTGLGAYLPFQIGRASFLTIMTPVYRGGMVPRSLKGRMAEFLGWVGMAVVPEVVLARALEGHSGTTVTLRYHSGASDVAFLSGVPPSHRQSSTISFHNGWTVTTSAAIAPVGVLENTDALALLITGIALSILLGLLLFVLGTGRERARREVTDQTGELRYQALHDGLTGLPNRALIMDRIEQLLARSHRNGTVGAALYLDLDEFKNVNDSLGHGVGDKLLVAVAARLHGILRDVDTIGRMGGDEFVVLLDAATLDAAPELVANRLLEVLRQPFELDGTTTSLMVSASIGIAVGDRASPGDLLRDADVALYQAKGAGKNCFKVFNPDMHTGNQRRIELEFELRFALEASQFRLEYQPIFNLDDLTMIGVEALLRWDHPIRGVIQPDEFIPILEQTGQICEVGQWVLAQACTQMATWHARGNVLDVSVNVSGRQLEDDAIVATISKALQESGLSSSSLIIEITETALMRQPIATARRLREIKALGVRIAVDDFGTGYSSLAYLQQFPVDCLKIDRVFTAAITTSPESKALIETLVQLGKALGLTTLAEGVETLDQRDLLRAENVSEAQGFLFSRPLDPATLEARHLAPARARAGLSA
jgi:diguanylate cyclase (GGDEF)-like protein